jgi:hypothetical protein
MVFPFEFVELTSECSRLFNPAVSQINEWRIHLYLPENIHPNLSAAKTLLWLTLTFICPYIFTGWFIDGRYNLSFWENTFYVCQDLFSASRRRTNIILWKLQ